MWWIFGNIFVVLRRGVSLEVVYEVRLIWGRFIRVDKLYRITLFYIISFHTTFSHSHQFHTSSHHLYPHDHTPYMISIKLSQHSNQRYSKFVKTYLFSKRKHLKTSQENNMPVLGMHYFIPVPPCFPALFHDFSCLGCRRWALCNQISHFGPV